MLDAVARQERHLVIADGADGDRCARGAVRGVEADAARIGSEERVEAATTDDSEHPTIVWPTARWQAALARLRCLVHGHGLYRARASTARMGVAAAAGVVAAIVVGLDGRVAVRPGRRLDRRRGVYLAWTWLLVGPMDAAATEQHATSHGDDDSTPRMAELIVVLASLASLAGVGYLLVAESTQGRDVASAVVGILSVAASWVTVHTAFMLRYARLYFPDKAIDFHQTGHRADLRRLRLPGVHRRNDLPGVRHRPGDPARCAGRCCSRRWCRSCSVRSSWR